jgi:DNA polymerase III epsilon subunit-like protein
MPPRVIDIETTGTDPTVDAIIEIASVDLLKDGTIANQRTALVRPPLPVPPGSSAVHHLIDEDLAFAPELEDTLSLIGIWTDSAFERSIVTSSRVRSTESHAVICSGA